DGAHALLDEARGILAADPDAHHLRGELRRLEADLGRGERRENLLGEPLSEAELVVLRLLGTELTRREIGQERFLSLNTVRSHTRAIFRKLGVSCRIEAVARAREAGLIEPTGDPGRSIHPGPP